MSEALPDLTITVARAVDAAFARLPRQLGNASAWARLILAGTRNSQGCAVCDSAVATELHHFAGKLNSDLTVPACLSCHDRLSERQNGWDPRWQRPGNPAGLKQTLLLRGLSDLCEERARFHGLAYHELAKRLGASYAILARGTV